MQNKPNTTIPEVEYDCYLHAALDDFFNDSADENQEVQIKQPIHSDVHREISCPRG